MAGGELEMTDLSYNETMKREEGGRSAVTEMLRNVLDPNNKLKMNLDEMLILVEKYKDFWYVANRSGNDWYAKTCRG